MGGDDSQKLLPWRGMILLSGAQTSGSLGIQHCSGKLRGWELAATSPRAVGAQLQTAWVTFGKQTWVTSPARRRVGRPSKNKGLPQLLPATVGRTVLECVI